MKIGCHFLSECPLLLRNAKLNSRHTIDLPVSCKRLGTLNNGATWMDDAGFRANWSCNIFLHTPSRSCAWNKQQRCVYTCAANSNFHELNSTTKDEKITVTFLPEGHESKNFALPEQKRDLNALIHCRCLRTIKCITKCTTHRQYTIQIIRNKILTDAFSFSLIQAFRYKNHWKSRASSSCHDDAVTSQHFELTSKGAFFN